MFCVLTLGGFFGVSGTLGHGSLSAAQGNVSLQITPGDVAVGATMTLRGTNFTPHGRIGLTRDSSVPVADTGGQVVIEADAAGNFSDTAIVGQDWGIGSHTINAEDATTHKIATFPIRVGGQGVDLRPAHLKRFVASPSARSSQVRICSESQTTPAPGNHSADSLSTTPIGRTVSGAQCFG